VPASRKTRFVRERPRKGEEKGGKKLKEKKGRRKGNDLWGGTSTQEKYSVRPGT